MATEQNRIVTVGYFPLINNSRLPSWLGLVPVPLGARHHKTASRIVSALPGLKITYEQVVLTAWDNSRDFDTAMIGTVACLWWASRIFWSNAVLLVSVKINFQIGKWNFRHKSWACRIYSKMVDKKLLYFKKMNVINYLLCSRRLFPNRWQEGREPRENPVTASSGPRQSCIRTCVQI